MAVCLLVSTGSCVRAVNIRNGTFLTYQRPVLLHVLYIPLIEATASSSAPGVAWIVVGKQCARRGVLGFLEETLDFCCGREALVYKPLISPPQQSVSYIIPFLILTAALIGIMK